MADNTNNGGCDTNSCCGISLLGRSLSLSLTIPVLILATAGTVLLSAGWIAGGQLLVGDSEDLKNIVVGRRQHGWSLVWPHDASLG